MEKVAWIVFRSVGLKDDCIKAIDLKKERFVKIIIEIFKH